MPFGLKNAGATYQRMITCLHTQVGKTIEAYVDDVVIKTNNRHPHKRTAADLC